MEKDWVKLITTTSPIQAEILKGMLEENNIAVVLLNKQASSYVVFGEVELYVMSKDAETAFTLIQQNPSP